MNKMKGTLKRKLNLRTESVNRYTPGTPNQQQNYGLILVPFQFIAGSGSFAYL